MFNFICENAVLQLKRNITHSKMEFQWLHLLHLWWQTFLWTGQYAMWIRLDAPSHTMSLCWWCFLCICDRYFMITS